MFELQRSGIFIEYSGQMNLQPQRGGIFGLIPDDAAPTELGLFLGFLLLQICRPSRALMRPTLDVAIRAGVRHRRVVPLLLCLPK